MNSAYYKLLKACVFFLLALPAITLVRASELSLCISDNNSEIHLITDSYKISQWPWTFDFQGDLKLATKMPESERHELLLKLPDTTLPNIKECWNINAAALTDHYPRFQNLIANNTIQHGNGSGIRVFTHDLKHDDANPGSRLAMRRGYIVGIVSLALINHLFPKYAYVGWLALVACFIFPDHAERAVDEIHRLATTPITNQGQHNWGQGSSLGSSGTNTGSNYGYSSSTIFSGHKKAKDPKIVSKGKNVHGFGPLH
ncbi:hypothetical protein [Endozoicomonas euniceicola]|uniref:Uncharacterized protein n=1 Tax=Endozoicomonas euniceicola TaxID=1234143 RepID=A0ABY6GZD3_9GAMM|nr:hypothetical protein [Endozoicomonas euniceicola]UYM17353.1 hypothetical protein NX720_05380 [Endozoicomonas euniceicola]